jgi:hypothetical protein
MSTLPALVVFVCNGMWRALPFCRAMMLLGGPQYMICKGDKKQVIDM